MAVSEFNDAMQTGVILGKMIDTNAPHAFKRGVRRNTTSFRSELGATLRLVVS